MLPILNYPIGNKIKKKKINENRSSAIFVDILLSCNWNVRGDMDTRYFTEIQIFIHIGKKEKYVINIIRSGLRVVTINTVKWVCGQYPLNYPLYAVLSLTLLYDINFSYGLP